MNEFLGVLRSFGIARLGAIIGVTMGVAIALGLIIARIGETPQGILYADLDMRDGQRVGERLNQEGVKYSIRDQNGKISILVPRDRVSSLKMSFADSGLVASGNIGYELFDQNSSFGASSFQQNINRLRALEGELGRTISSIDGVRSARIHLVLPERELFARDKKPASASIVVDAPRGLSQSSVTAIVDFAAGAVAELTPADVTILDSSGQLLASGQNDPNSPSLMGKEDKTVAIESRIRRTIEDIVGRIVGAENLRVQVAAEIDYNRVTEKSEIIDPDSQTVLSSTVVEETANDVNPSAARGVSVANSLPGATTFGSDNATATATSANQRTEETTNYEISRTIRQEVREVGGIKRLSVAVALNAGTSPRTEAELTRLTTIVRSAIGYNSERGDQVDLVEVPFVDAQAPQLTLPTTAPETSALTRTQVMRLAEVGALSVIAIALVLFVLKPIFSDATQISTKKTTDLEKLTTTEQAQSVSEISTDEFGKKLNLSQVDGQMRDSSLKQISEVVKGHTDESASILRSWIREAS